MEINEGTSKDGRMLPCNFLKDMMSVLTKIIDTRPLSVFLSMREKLSIIRVKKGGRALRSCLWDMTWSPISFLQTLFALFYGDIKSTKGN